MNDINEYFKNQTIPKILLIFAVTLTLIISGLAANKVLGSFSDDSGSMVKSVKEQKIAENDTEQADNEQTENNETEDDTVLATPIPSPSVASKIAVKAAKPIGTIANKLSATVTPTPTQASSSNTNNSTACIITLWGKQYNVTTLRTTHSGGNIFNCGTDMTAVYQARHGTDLSRMQKYSVNNTNSTTNTGSIGQNTGSYKGTSHEEENEEREYNNDEEHEDRYIDD